ncbi:MAG: hypothetical protein LCH99_15560 [Proteobacteria bacterium]|nr:hypothetical protein [Pseudomonadota bacterium]
MTIFERIIPFPQRLQWLMLKMALDGGFTADLIAKRLGWTLQKVYQCIWRDPGKMRIDTVAEWFFACGGTMPHFEVVPDP